MGKLSLCLVFLLSALSLFAQRTIPEKIIDKKGNPVANASVTTDGCQHSD